MDHVGVCWERMYRGEICLRRPMMQELFPFDFLSCTILSPLVFSSTTHPFHKLSSNPILVEYRLNKPQRLKEMKQMSRDPLAAAKARKAERRADEKSGGITIKPMSLPSADSGKTGFKKGGFKNAFRGGDDGGDVDNLGVKKEGNGEKKEVKVVVEGWEVESESEEEWGDYDPKRPTGCTGDCRGGGK